MEKRFQRSSRVSESRVGEKVILYHKSDKKAVVLNPTGAWVWEVITSPHTLDALSELLRGHYPELTQERAKQDLSTYLAELEGQKVIESI